MTEEVRNKLSEFFETRLEETRMFYAVIRDYFSEKLTDLQLPTFQAFESKLQGKRLDNYILAASGNNSYGTYSMEVDYYESHKDCPFLESITDLGIIDFCTEFLINSMPEAYILIKFPEVKVTNEHNRSVNIKDLYVRLTLRGNRIQGTFYMIRTTYDIVQWLSCYSHSHLMRISNQALPIWRFPCLGSGPIKTTLNRLIHAYDEDILGLFCLELSKYVTVESLEGVPYIRLESIGANGSYILPSKYNGNLNVTEYFIEDFIKYFIKNASIKFSYINGNYALGESLLEFWIRISNYFIDWYNRMHRQGKFKGTLGSLEDHNIVQSLIISEGKASTPLTDFSISDIENINHSDMFVFKGAMQQLNIEGVDDFFNQNKSTLLSYQICEYVLTCILKLINYKYGRTNDNKGELKVSKKCFYF